MSANDIVLSSAGASVAVPSDPNFENVSLLLSGDGTNGAQNNTFLDSSTNNFTITRNGNTTQGSFSPYGNLWSNYFNGSSNLTFPNSSAWDLTGDYTIECSIFITSTPVSATFIQIGTNSLILYVSASTKQISTAGSLSITSSTSITLSTWNHIALVRSGSGTNNTKLYINGIAVGQTTDNTSFAGSSSNGFRVGSEYPSDYYINGYISNVRLVNGTAVYTSNFTPPTTPLTAITNTQLLTCQSNRFLDASSNNFTATLGGTPSVQRFSPFNPTAPYSTSVIGGSGYFDGSGDYLTLPSSSNLAFGTGDFSVEAWVYPTSLASNANVISNATSDDTQFGFLWLTNGELRLASWNIAFLVSSSGVITANQWQHIICCRSGTTASLFVNGVRVATATVTNNFSSTNAMNIGRNPTPFDYLYGYMTDLRILKGSSAYSASSSTVTIPSAPVTAITNTSLLTNFTNAGIPDLAMQNNLETVGNAQVSTSVKKYGTGSLAFDGTGDYLVTAPSVNYQLGTGDFTVEFLVYVNSYVDGDTALCIGTKGTYYANLMIRMNSNWTVSIGNGSSWSVSDQQFGVKSTGSWNHIAIVRQSGTLYAYYNGVSGYTVSNSTNLVLQQVTLGAETANNLYLNGYMDDVRITKGLARYPSGTTFTPPTAALPTY